MMRIDQSRFLMLTLLVVAVWGSSVYAQQITGAVTGTVLDSSGAAVVGASVTLTNTGTAFAQTTNTDASGNFQFLLLQPGTYLVETSTQGFKSFRRDGIIVEADRSLAVPVTLEIGQTSETVEVVGGTPLLEPNTSEVGTTVDSQKVMDLPLNSRNPMGLANLIPTVKGVGFFGGQILTSWRVGSINIGGGQALTSAFLLDGVANDKMGDAAGANTFLTTDSTGEFKIITNDMSAAYGRTTGGVVMFISKSGTNEYHGSAFEYLQNTALNANSYFSNKAGTPLAPVHQNQFGGALGGRIIKDKLFFFANYEGFIQHLSNSEIVTSPTALERQGNFSQITAASGQVIAIYDPLSTVTNSSGASVRTPFPGNIIPASRISQFAQEFLSLYPQPNLPGQNNNLFLIGQAPTTRETGGIKVDYLLNSAQRMAFRFTGDALTETDPSGNFFHSPLDSSTHLIYVPRHSGLVSYTNTLSPTLVLDIRSSINRDYDQQTPWSYTGQFKNTNYLTALGLPQALVNQLPPNDQCFPALTVSGLGPAANTFGQGCAATRPAYEWGEVVSLTKIWHEHSFQFGYQYTLYRSAPYNAASPAFTFSGGYTQGPNPTVSSATAGLGLASLELGDPASGSFNYQNSHDYQELDHGLYVQDDWKVNHKLTLNLGLRWEYQGPWTDRHNEMTDFSTTATTTVNGLVLRGGTIFPGVNGIPRGVVDTVFDHFAPRFGYAYQVTSKLVARGGYGVYWVPEKGVLTPGATGFTQATTMVASLNNGLTPYNTVSNPYPQGIVLPTGSSAGLLTDLGQAISAQVRNAFPGYAQQWNFTLQYSPWPNWLVEAAYLGNKGTHLQDGGDNAANNLDQLNPSYLSLGNALNTQVPNPYYGLVANGQLSTPTITLQQSLLPFPQYTSILAGWFYPGASFYNAFTLKVEKRLSQGFSVLLSYVNSKLLDASAETSSVTGGNSATYNLNMYNLLEGEYSKAVQDIPQRLVITGLWAEPFFKSGPRWQRMILGGWNFSEVTTFQSGQTLSPVASGNVTTAVNSTTTNRPNVVYGVSDRLANPTLAEWFNTAAFSLPAPFTFGDASRTIPNIMGPRLINADVALYKEFVIKERYKLALRGEAFNLFNRPDFGNPNLSVGTPAFGTISSLLVNPLPRNVQLSMRVTF
jgi:hypothetical protein